MEKQPVTAASRGSVWSSELIIHSISFTVTEALLVCLDVGGAVIATPASVALTCISSNYTQHIFPYDFHTRFFDAGKLKPLHVV